jgi:hypothetical protein
MFDSLNKTDALTQLKSVSHCWKHFWNSCCGIAFSAVVPFFGCLQNPKIFVTSRQTLFLERATSNSEPNQGNRVGVPFQQSIFWARNSLIESVL